MNFPRTCHIYDAWLNNCRVFKKKESILISISTVSHSFGAFFHIWKILIHRALNIEHSTDVIKDFNRRQKERNCSIVICHNVLMWLLFNHEYHGNKLHCLKHLTCYIFKQTIFVSSCDLSFFRWFPSKSCIFVERISKFSLKDSA